TPTTWRSACVRPTTAETPVRWGPCDCNGNSDPNMLFVDCHSQTGKCLSCMHNTAGDRCHLCAPGFYGDEDPCQCDCSPCGTKSCDPHSGQCHCKPGVTGARCERCECAPGFWDYGANGCKSECAGRAEGNLLFSLNVLKYFFFYTFTCVHKNVCFF
uniref:Laminin EGF-like domain-containing protein n=1 Tax=Oryzias melastigma TaxID=30732 RepID=A0A3B3DZW0_ORYME